ncbi:MAG: FAD-dependent oxidoreductase [Lysobacterales bacterium]
MSDDPILIAGGGPIGYTLAANLDRYGIAFLLLEAGDRIFSDPRAGTIHPPSLELFRDLGLIDVLLERGNIVKSFQYRDRRQGLVAEFDLTSLADETDFPYRLMLEQHKVCEVIHDHLTPKYNQQIRREHRLISVSQNEAGVAAQVETPDGTKTIRGRYIVGCDGGRSQVRKSMNVDFNGFQYPERFLVLSTPFNFAEFGYGFTNYIADPKEWCALFKVPGNSGMGMWRVVFPTQPEQSEDELFDEINVQRRIQRFHKKQGPYDVVHRNLYAVHQRVASCYRDGRLLLAGDAAHINNPLGGMGMNFGFHDAFNLSEKLHQICNKGADDGLFDQYDRQRRTVASEYLQRQTMENKNNIEQQDPALRKRFYSDLKDIANDPARRKNYLMRAAMIEGFRHSQSIE